MTTPITRGQAATSLLVNNFVTPGIFVLLWNVFDVSGAVGLGTVNYFTAFGVNIVGGVIVGAITLAAYSGIRSWKKYYDALT